MTFRKCIRIPLARCVVTIFFITGGERCKCQGRLKLKGTLLTNNNDDVQLRTKEMPYYCF